MLIEDQTRFFIFARLIEIKETTDKVLSDTVPRRQGKPGFSLAFCKELEMDTLVRITALAVTAAAALFSAQPSRAITPVVQLHSIIADTAVGSSLVTTVARRGGAYRGRTAYRGRRVYRGHGVYGV